MSQITDTVNGMSARDLRSILVGETQDNIVCEGGNMFDDVTRINQENVAATLKYIYSEILPALGIDRKFVQPLGSVGKKLPGGSSGDIDLGIDATRVEYLQDSKDLVKDLYWHCKPILDDMGIECHMIPTLFSIKCPIQNFDGKQEGEFVQLDMMVTRNMKFQNWSQYADKEREGQKYIKGAIRNLIFEAAAHAMDDIKVLKTGLVKTRNGIEEAPIEWEEYSFYTPEGLNIKHCKREPMAKQPKDAPDIVYKSGETSTRSLVSDDPDVIAKKMFGVKARDLLTWDGAWNAAKDSSWGKDPSKWDVFKQSLREKLMPKISAGFDIPDEMIEELGLAQQINESALVNEGGNRFEKAGKINQDNYKATYDKLVDMLKREFDLDDDDFASTGSGGKKLGGGKTKKDGTYVPNAQSGDIDVAINKQKVCKNMGIETVHEWIDAVQDMCERNGLECSCSDRWEWIGACSILMPIENVDGHQENQFVQADLMICDNLKYQSWSKYAPEEVKGEKYVKGLVRNAILRSIAKAIWFMDDVRGKVNKRGDNEPLSWSKYVFDKEGLFKKHYKRELMKGKKGEEGIYKSTPTPGEKEFITDDPDELCELLCGVDSANMLTWKQAWDIAKKKRIFNDKDQLARFKENLEHEIKYELDKGNLKYVPDEIAKFIDYDPRTFKPRERNKEREETVDEAFKRRKEQVSDLDTEKASMKKIHQLQGTQLRNFLSDFINGFKEGKILIPTTPKIDGSAFRIGWCDGNVFVENSRSGLLNAGSKTLQIPISHRNVAKCVNKQGTDKIFSKISSMGLSGVKVIGELLSNSDNIVDDDGSITYVGSSYDASKLGKVGSLVVFSAQEMTKESLKDMDKDKQQEFINFLSDEISDSQFSYFNLQRFAQQVSLEYDMFPRELMDELKSTDPSEMGKQQAESLRDRINSTLTEMYKTQFKSPDIMSNGDTLEGVVLELNGNTYGIHYDSWKEIKNKNLGLSTDIDDLFKRMVGELVDMSPNVGMGKMFAKLRQNKDMYQDKYKELLPKFKGMIEDIRKRGQDMSGMSKYARELTKGKYERFLRIVDDVPLTDDIDSLIQLVDGKVDDLEGSKICLIAGSFKPPHRGHFNMVKQYAKECDKVFVGISNPSATSSREDANGREIPNFVSKEIFEIYCDAAGLDNVSIETSKNPTSWLRFKLQHVKNAKVILGISDKDDPSRFDMFDNEEFKRGLNNVEILPIKDNAVKASIGGDGNALSATRIRDNIDDKEEVRKMLPFELSEQQVDRVFDLLNQDEEDGELVSEGGHAKSDIPEELKSRINQENVEATLDDICERLLPKIGLTKDDVECVGSTGKKLPGGTIGDIDLAMPQQKIMDALGIETPEEFIDHCQDAFDSLGAYDASAPGHGWKSVSCFWPIQSVDGKQDGKFVQLDFVVTTNMKYITWGMHSDQERELQDGDIEDDVNPKSAVRMILLKSIAMGGHSIVNKRGSVSGVGDDEPVDMDRYDIVFNEGLFKVHRERKLKRNGEYSKTWSSSKEFVTDDPDEIVRTIFNDNGMSASDLMSVRDVWDAFLDSEMYQDPETRHEIGRCFQGQMEQHKGRYGYPSWIGFD